MGKREESESKQKYNEERIQIKDGGQKEKN
jgi:hypothetical protein